MCLYLLSTAFDNLSSFSHSFQRPNETVAIKAIAKKNLAKSQNLLGKEIKILKVRLNFISKLGFFSVKEHQLEHILIRAHQY